MISQQPTPPADARAPAASRASPATPEGIAGLLSMVRILLDFGRHLAAAIEHHAAGRGAWLFSAVFGTDKLPVMSAYIHRGILRAIALESLLLAQAATGRDLAPASPRPCAAPNADANDALWNEPFDAQSARLTAERAQHDAGIDPDHLSTQEAIEAEVLCHPIGRTIAAICRDFGIVAMMCAREFWDATMQAIACYDNIAIDCPEARQPNPQASRRQPGQDLPPEQLDRPHSQHSRQCAARIIGRPPFAPFRNGSAPAHLPVNDNVPYPNGKPAPTPAATGPPRRAPIKLAA